ncbi:hypothetical protein B0H12DRAFT_1071128 [Mycena haematopus]|nr:hypothetical protein B0H12DRAFT_1071128 [Mycena haematopus]
MVWQRKTRERDATQHIAIPNESNTMHRKDELSTKGSRGMIERVRALEVRALKGVEWRETGEWIGGGRTEEAGERKREEVESGEDGLVEGFINKEKNIKGRRPPHNIRAPERLWIALAERARGSGDKKKRYHLQKFFSRGSLTPPPFPSFHIGKVVPTPGPDRRSRLPRGINIPMVCNSGFPINSTSRRPQRRLLGTLEHQSTCMPKKRAMPPMRLHRSRRKSTVEESDCPNRKRTTSTFVVEFRSEDREPMG